MPVVTAVARGQENGQVVTEFVDTVGTGATTYTYQNTNDILQIRNTGTVNLNVTAGANSATVAPREARTLQGSFNALVISAAGSIGSFEAKAIENSIRIITTLPVNRTKFDSSNVVLKTTRMLSDFYFTSGPVSVDPINSFNGGPAILLTSDNNGVTEVKMDIGAATDFTNVDYIDVYAKVDNTDNLSAFQIDLMNDNGSVNRYSFQNPNRLKEIKDNVWQCFRLHKVDSFITVYGTPSWTTIRYIRLLVRSNPGTTVNFTLGQLNRATLDKPALFMYFDDGFDSQYIKGFSTMRKYGLRGTFGVITSWIDRQGKVTWSNLQEMKAAGWDIVSHTHNHIQIDVTDETTLRVDLAMSKKILADHGFHFGSNVLVCPFGGWSQASDAIIKDYYSIVRASSVAKTNPTFPFPHIHPRFQNYTSPYNTDTVATVQGWIDTAISNKKQLSLAWHNLLDTNPSNDTFSYLTADFDAVCAYIKTKQDAGLINVMTISDLMLPSSNKRALDVEGKKFITTANGTQQLFCF